MSPIELLAMESQEQHRRYHELFGLNPVGGDGLRDLARRARGLASGSARCAKASSTSTSRRR